MTDTRDISQAQFERKLKQYGIRPDGPFGYYRLPCGVSVSVLNTNTTRRRTWLAYLLDRQAKLSKEYGTLRCLYCHRDIPRGQECTLESCVEQRTAAERRMGVS